ncbi:GntR family transcriptional regulator [Microtetraspora malaysiensis]|uniref:GntR family transcriptional regulator n=1 Tax=Microtetraspora malaysiensis TaxID=161358 RepID=UPI003D8FC45D
MMAVSPRKPLAALPLERRPAAQQIAESLQAAILSGELRSGDPLREAELAATFCVARNTVREALRLLTQKGLASHEVHRGVSVRRFTADEITHLFHTRAIIESAAAERAGNLTPAEAERLGNILTASERAAEAHDYSDVRTQNQEFHRALVGLLGNPRLDQIFDQITTEITLTLVPLERDVAGPWLARNRELLRLLAVGDAAGFRAEIIRYLNQSMDDVAGRLADPTTPPAPSGRGTL